MRKHDFDDIKNKNIIKLEPAWRFVYVEHADYARKSPVSEYYLKLSDLSINVLISLKWANFAYFFFKNISETIIDINNSDYGLRKQLPNDINYDVSHKEHMLYIDHFLINNFESYKNIIDKEYISELFSENAKVRFKLIINFDDFILLQNCFIPVIYFQETIGGF
jgi:hypothetical protein